ncbi:MAG: hypothetical protein K2Q22_10015 [Cytophagales bacterium]|nr:hypothetical protein [Cytophagales bacterium]
MKSIYRLFTALSLIAFTISCAKKNQDSPAPDLRENVVGNYYDSKVIVKYNGSAISSYSSLLSTLVNATIPSAFLRDTSFSIGSFNSKFKIIKDPTNDAQALFRDTNQTSPTTLFYGNAFTSSGPITTFYIPSQSLSTTIFASFGTIPGAFNNLISIKGIPNYTSNSIGYDGGYNSGNKQITAYAKGQVNFSILSIDNLFTLTITGTKQ